MSLTRIPGKLSIIANGLLFVFLEVLELTRAQTAPPLTTLCGFSLVRTLLF